jgi:uncharacterized integral membrane protein
MLHKVKLVVIALLFLGLALFILQNREIIELRFLFWDFESRRAYMLISVFAGGFVCGWIFATVNQLQQRSREDLDRHHDAHLHANQQPGQQPDQHLDR